MLAPPWWTTGTVELEDVVPLIELSEVGSDDAPKPMIDDVDALSSAFGSGNELSAASPPPVQDNMSRHSTNR